MCGCINECISSIVSRCNHIASLVASDAAMYSASLVERELKLQPPRYGASTIGEHVAGSGFPIVWIVSVIGIRVQ